MVDLGIQVIKLYPAEVPSSDVNFVNGLVIRSCMNLLIKAYMI